MAFVTPSMVIDKTGDFNRLMLDYPDPISFEKEQNKMFEHWDRGFEIWCWLKNNALPDDKFAIVDDDNDMWILQDKFVRTTWQQGLQQEETNKICEILGEKDSQE